MQREVTISLAFFVKIYYTAGGRYAFYIGCIDETISVTLDEQLVRLYFCVLNFDRVIGVGFYVVP